MGAGIKEQFSDGFLFDEFGVITGSFAQRQFPNKPCGMMRLKARSSNVGSFYIGHMSGTHPILPYQLAPGDDTGWVITTNLNRYFFGGASGTSDVLAYWLQK